MADAVPLSERKLDYAFLVFFAINLLVITYIVDIEQLTIPSMAGAWEYPSWPPRWAVDIIHDYGNTHDPLQIARPVWWKMTIWIDALIFGPFYVAALYAFIKGRDWIRIPAVFYSGLMFANVTIILGEEFAGPHAAPNFPYVLALNLPWLLFPLFITARLWRAAQFSRR